MSLNIKAPLIVGGVGGSGTRAVVAILQNAGAFMGSYNNVANDNLHFARLISDHTDKWKRSYSDLQFNLNTFHRLYFGQTLFPHHIACIYACARQPRLKQTWLLIRRSHDVNTPINTFPRWGFKNPSTCFFLPQLTEHYPECKYIHVIRHGLDMAFSSNTIQLKNWGPEFNVASHDGHFTAQQQLDFWIGANQFSIQTCQRLIPDRHYILNFDRLCLYPELEINKLFAFLEFNPATAITGLTHLVTLPSSTGRYKDHLHLFTAEQIQAVRDFGFDVG